MAGSPGNPFVSPEPSEPDPSLAPFARGADRRHPANDIKSQLKRQVKDLSFPDSKALQLATPRVSELSVQDLNDLAAQFAGVATTNPAIENLTIEDINSIEAVFVEAKIAAIKDLAQSASASADGAPGIFDGWSCCCCTPCCCCAATATNPFD